MILIIIVAIKMKNDKDSEEFSIPYSYIPDEKDSTEEVENDLDDTSIEEPKKKKHPKGKRFK